MTAYGLSFGLSLLWKASDSNGLHELDRASFGNDTPNARASELIVDYKAESDDRRFRMEIFRNRAILRKNEQERPARRLFLAVFPSGERHSVIGLSFGIERNGTEFAILILKSAKLNRNWLRKCEVCSAILHGHRHTSQNAGFSVPIHEFPRRVLGAKARPYQRDFGHSISEKEIGLFPLLVEASPRHPHAYSRCEKRKIAAKRRKPALDTACIASAECNSKIIGHFGQKPHRKYDQTQRADSGNANPKTLIVPHVSLVSFRINHAATLRCRASILRAMLREIRKFSRCFFVEFLRATRRWQIVPSFIQLALKEV